MKLFSMKKKKKKNLSHIYRYSNTTPLGINLKHKLEKIRRCARNVREGNRNLSTSSEAASRHLQYSPYIKQSSTNLWCKSLQSTNTHALFAKAHQGTKIHAYLPFTTISIGINPPIILRNLGSTFKPSSVSTNCT